MQLFAIIAFMIVLPIGSVVVELSTSNAEVLPSIGKWFVFWGVGARLATAGIKQMVTPEFTAKQIFKIGDPAAAEIVTELGFGNLAIGLIALLTLQFPSWLAASALAGAVFFGLAGTQHIRNGRMNRLEAVAMISDLFIAAILLIYLGSLVV